MIYSRFFLLVSLSLLLAVGGIVINTQHRVVTEQTGSCIDIAATPDYLSSRDPHDAIAAINYARQQEHVRALRLPENFYQLSPVQQEFVVLNLERTDRDLQPLYLDDMLSQMAQAYSQQMRDLKFFSHTSPIGGAFSDRINGNVLLYNHYRMAAENLAGNPVPGLGAMYEYMYDDTVENCGHRQNILEPQLRLVGIGMVTGSSYGSISAQEFLSAASWNPYVSVPAQQTKPSISITANVAKKDQQIQLVAHQVSSDPLVRVTWFIDNLDQLQYVGNAWTMNTHHLKPGKHTILAYGVDGVQQYAVASYTIP